jgi:GABA(A) receptor-associated protein
MVKPFQQEFSIEKRKAESTRIKNKFPDLVPVICERAAGGSSVPDLDRRKFLVPPHLTMGQFVYVVRKRIKLDASQAIFMYISNSLLVPTSQTITLVYDEHKDDDGFLYVTYSGENTFG